MYSMCVCACARCVFVCVKVFVRMCISLWEMTVYLQRPTPLVPFNRMYCLSHSKCTFLFIFPPWPLYTHTNTQKQGNRRQPRDANPDFHIFHCLLWLQPLTETRDDYYKTQRWCHLLTFSSLVVILGGFQCAYYAFWIQTGRWGADKICILANKMAHMRCT